MRPGKSLCGGVLLLALTWLGLAAPLGAQEPFAKSVGEVKVADVAKGDVIEVPFILWGGDVATFLANGGLVTKDGSIFQKQGLKLKLVPGDDFPKQVKSYLEGKTPFLRGTMSMLGLASEVTGKDPRTRPVVFLQLTWSAGDHLVTRAPLKTLGDLKGKKIALQKGGPHVGMLDDILRTARLKWADIKVVWTDDVTGDKGPAAVFRKDAGVDGCFAITPDMTDLSGGLTAKGTGEKGTVKGAHVLVSTADMKRSIADVYACRKDFYDANKALVEKFAAGYLRGCEELVAARKQHQEKKGGNYKALLELTQQIYGKDAIKSLDDADGLIADAVFVGLPGNRSFFAVAGNLSGFGPKAKAALDLAVGQGYASKRYELAKAEIDYNRLKTLGGLKTSPEELPGGFIEAAKLPSANDLSENTLYFFTINFEPNQKTFEEEKYGEDFHRALEQASLFGNSMVAVRGHADLAKVLNEFVKASMSKGILRRAGKPGKFEFFTKDGTKLDLNNTRKVVELIEKEDFGGTELDPKQTVKALLRLSEERAESVRQALMEYAAAHKIVLDKNQIRSTGVGILEPIVPQPRTDEQMGRNRRVEFRIIRVPAEAQSARDFDY
jgi:ABC-type nitrate/sulfonate/bicarbonate transport system substrate-binding protein